MKFLSQNNNNNIDHKRIDFKSTSSIDTRLYFLLLELRLCNIDILSSS